MMYPLTQIWVWQLLRTLVRNKNKPLTGRQLRVQPNRITIDGTFLDELVANGLLECVEVAEPQLPKFKGAKVEPPQFRSTYRLTEMGKHAAEYGEFEKASPFPPLPQVEAKPGKAR